MYQNVGYLSEALSAGATELADDFAAHGQKGLTGHPACQLFPAGSVRAVREYRVRSSTHLLRPTETLRRVNSNLLYTYNIFLHILQFSAEHLFTLKKNAVLTVMRWGIAV